MNVRPELQTAFFHDDEGYIARLRSASATPEEIFRTVHTLKSVTLMLGLENLASVLSEAEDHLVCKQTGKAETAIQRFLAAFENAKKEFLARVRRDSAPAEPSEEVAEVLFRPRVLVSLKGFRYVYHRRELIRLEGPANLDWVVLIYAEEGLKALAVSEVSQYSSEYRYAA